MLSHGQNFFGLGISGLWILGLRPLLIRNHNNKDSAYFSSYRQARKTVKFRLHCIKFQINVCKCYTLPQTLETLFSGHIQVGIKTVLVSGTVL